MKRPEASSHRRGIIPRKRARQSSSRSSAMMYRPRSSACMFYCRLQRQQRQGHLKRNFKWLHEREKEGAWKSSAGCACVWCPCVCVCVCACVVSCASVLMLVVYDIRDSTELGKINFVCLCVGQSCSELGALFSCARNNNNKACNVYISAHTMSSHPSLVTSPHVIPTCFSGNISGHMLTIWFDLVVVFLCISFVLGNIQ